MKNIFIKRLKNIFSVLLLFYIGLLVLSCKAQFMGDIMGRIDEIYSSNIYFCPSSLNLDTYVCQSYQIGEEVLAEDLPTSVDDSRFSSFKPGYEVDGWTFYAYGSLVDDNLKAFSTSPNSDEIITSDSDSTIKSIKITNNHLILTAIYSLSDNTPYSVIPILESLDNANSYEEDDDYTQEYGQIFYGTTFTDIELEVIDSVIYLNGEEIEMEIPGFEILAEQDKIEDIINADGSTVLKIKFCRKTVTVTIDPNGASPSTAYPISGKYGAPFEFDPSVYTKENCELVGWIQICNGISTEVESLPETFPAYNTVYMAKWSSSGVGGLDIDIPGNFTDIRIYNNTLTSKSNTYGAGIYLDSGSSCWFKKSVFFYDNTSSGTLSGAAVYKNNSATLKIGNSTEDVLIRIDDLYIGKTETETINPITVLGLPQKSSESNVDYILKIDNSNLSDGDKILKFQDHSLSTALSIFTSVIKGYYQVKDSSTNNGHFKFDYTDSCVHAIYKEWDEVSEASGVTILPGNNNYVEYDLGQMSKSYISLSSDDLTLTLKIPAATYNVISSSDKSVSAVLYGPDGTIKIAVIIANISSTEDNGYFPVVFQNLVDSSYTIGSYTLVCSAKAEDSSNVIATKSYTIAVVY